MSQAGEYRQKAAECQQQAKLSITPLDKQHWLRLAEHWLKMMFSLKSNQRAFFQKFKRRIALR
jgi:hypothetical protein